MTQLDLDNLVDQLLATADSDSLLLLLLNHTNQLLTETAVQTLTERATNTEKHGRVVTTVRQLQAIFQNDPDRLYYEAFAAVRSREAMKQLRIDLADAQLDTIEQRAEQVIEDGGEQASAIEARLGDLRQLRQRTAAELMAEQAAEASRMAQAQAMLPLVETVETWANLEDLTASEAYLQSHADDLLSDAAANILLAFVAERGGDERLQRLALLHKRAREIGVAGAFGEMRIEQSGREVDLAAVEDAIFGWLQTADWNQSQAYMEEHTAVLLTEEAEIVLNVIQQHNPDHPSVPQHQALLRSCRANGVTQAYTDLRQGKIR